MTDNTQELDEILDHLMQYSFDYGRGTIPISENPPLIEARKAKRALLDWNNKQVEKMLDRLLEHGEDFTTFGDAGLSVAVEYIEAERNKLKEAEL